jgi:RepB DNA-primase from phage plasmid
MSQITETVQFDNLSDIWGDVEESEVEKGYQCQPEVTEAVKPIIDISIAKQFITALTGSPDTPMNFRTFAEAETSKSYAKKPKGSIASLAAELQRLNNEGSGVFLTVQQATGDKAEDVTAIRALFVDFDGHLPSESEWHLQPSIVVSTSDGGGHAYWVLSEPVAMSASQLTQLHKSIVAHYWEPFRSDFKATDIARVMRLPGSWHLKKEPTLVTIDHTGSERYSVEEVMAGISTDPSFVAKMEALASPKKPKGIRGYVGTDTRKDKPSDTSFWRE